MKRPLYAFDYMKSFECTGSACEDTCCVGWKINLYKDDFEKFQDLFKKPEAPPGGFDRYIKPVEEKERIPECYGHLYSDSETGCAFLDDGWCVLHRDFGEVMLPRVCATFPRYILQRDDRLELSGVPACPEMARLILLSEDMLEMKKSDIALPPVHEINPLPERAAYYEKYLAAVDIFVKWLLYLKDYSTMERCYLVLYFCKRIASFFHDNLTKDPGQRLKGVISRLQDEEFIRKTVENFRTTTYNYEPISRFILAIINANLAGERHKRYNQLRTTALKSYNNQKGEPYFVDGHLNLAEDSALILWNEYLRRKETIQARFRERIDLYFGNFCLNFWHQNLFKGDPDLMIPNKKLLLYLGSIKFLLYSDPRIPPLLSLSDEEALPQLDAIAVNVVQIFMRNIDANSAVLQSLLKVMNSGGFPGIHELSALLKT